MGTEHEPLSIEATEQMLHCARVAEFILWDTDDTVHARTDSGAPCGTELPPRNGIRGWEVCGQCLKSQALRAALLTGLK
jgi:hypothetical protein